jgi:hypothetical protein
MPLCKFLRHVAQLDAVSHRKRQGIEKTHKPATAGIPAGIKVGFW